MLQVNTTAMTDAPLLPVKAGRVNYRDDKRRGLDVSVAPVTLL